MCGIAGIISDEAFQGGEDIVRMTDAMVHRGPDDWGYLTVNPGENSSIRTKDAPSGKAKILLGHRRLSIIDIEGTHQPLCNEEATVWVTFNGEIYNYCELRKTLILKGHTFKENGDTEVLVHLWEEYGERMLEHLVGMFAFGIYDSKQDVLFLARDRFGQKPLFYWEQEKSCIFSSELQALKQIDNFPVDDSDDIAIAQYFRYGYIPSPRTMYKNVFSLNSGHYLLRKEGKNSVVQYWKPEVSGEVTEVNLEELQDLIDKSVKSRLVSDVPLGTFLSGGIDSSLVTSSMVKQLNRKVDTFTISTGDYWCDESKEAQLIADHLGTNHYTFKVKPDFIDISSKLAKNYGQPFADHSAILTYYVSRETRTSATVALAGDGGDELFGGYGSYINSAKYAIVGRLPLFTRPIFAKFANIFYGTTHPNVIDAILSARSIPEKGENISVLFHDYWRKQSFSEDLKNRLSEVESNDLDLFISYFNEAKSDNLIDRWMEADQRMYLCDDILTKVDIASMAVSLECRAPFLDHRIAEFANRIASGSKLKHSQTKFLLKELVLIWN